MIASPSFFFTLVSLAAASHFDSPSSSHKTFKRINRRQDAPIQPVLLLAQDNSTTPANTTAPSYNATALWFNEVGKQGACLYTNTDADLIVGLPTSFWNDTTVPSPFCGQSLLIQCPSTGKNLTAMIADAAGKEYLTLTIASFLTLGGVLDDGMLNVTYSFLNSTNSNGTYSGNNYFTSTAHTAPIAAAAIVPSTVTPSTTPATTPAAQSPTFTDNSAALAAAAASSSAAASAASAQAEAAKSAAASRKAAEATPTPAPAPAALAPIQSVASAAVSVASSAAQVFTGGIATFYFQNGVTGHCGTVASDNDKVIAVESSMYAGGKNCNRQILITRTSTGKTAVGTVRDSCPTCVSHNSLDLSQALFNELGTANEGIFDITWKFLGA